MNKNEFLEILKDYLKKEFSENEIDEILRDYEEYFVDGIIEGKTDIQIIQSLGSPKAIANELISQNVDKNIEDLKSTKNKISDKYNLFKIRSKEIINKSKDTISEKLTLDLKDKDHNRNRKVIKVVLFILTAFLIVPSIAIGAILLSIGITLIALLAVFLGTIPFMYNFLKATPDVLGLYISLSIMFIGGQILGWQLYSFILRSCKKVVKKYQNWIKTRSIYIYASEKKEKYEKESIVYDEGRDEDDE